MNRRLVLYALLDLVVWGVVCFLLSSDPTANRLRFWYAATRAAQGCAETWGRVALTCEARYYQAARP